MVAFDIQLNCWHLPVPDSSTVESICSSRPGALEGSPTPRPSNAVVEEMSAVSAKNQKKQSCICHPSCLCLLTTICVTALASAMLMGSMFTDFWETLDYNATRVEEIARLHNGTHRLTWLFNGTVARIALYPSTASNSMSKAFPTIRTTTTQRMDQIVMPDTVSSTTVEASDIQKVRRRRRDGAKLRSHATSAFQVENGTRWKSSNKSADHHTHLQATHPKRRPPEQESASPVGSGRNRLAREIAASARQSAAQPPNSSPNTKWVLIHDKAPGSDEKYNPPARKAENSLIYLISLHGGIWRLCLSLKDDQLRILNDMGMNRNICMEYLVHNHYNDGATIARHDHHVQSKMHNLSISCAMVCLILLGAAALLGLFGILQRQISAVLITGVCYILAALFAVFSLTIMHFKRNSRRDCVILDDHISPEYHSARIFSFGWSMQLGWCGSSLLFIASLLWIFLAKVMRYNPLTFF